MPNEPIIDQTLQIMIDISEVLYRVNVTWAKCIVCMTLQSQAILVPKILVPVPMDEFAIL